MRRAHRNGVARQPLRPLPDQPPQHGRADVRHRPVVAEAPVALPARRAAPSRRSAPAAARARACGRCPGGPGPRRGRRVTISRSRSRRPSEQLADATRRSPRARRRTPRRPCGARRPGRSRSGSRTPAPAAHRQLARELAPPSRAPARCVAPGSEPRQPAAREQVLDLADADHLRARLRAAPAGSSRAGGASAKSRRRGVRAKRARLAPEGPRDHAPDRVRPGHRLRARAGTPRTARSGGSALDVRGELQHRVLGGVEDQRAVAQVLGAELARSR